MKLYFSPGACSLSPHIALHESGLDFEIERVDFATKKTASGDDYNAINPTGYVPALRLDDGQLLTEGPAILQYVADRTAADRKLAPPAGSFERYRLQETLNFIATEVHKSFGQLFNKDCPDAWKEVVRGNLGRRFASLDKLLAEQPFVLGADFTVADGYLFTVLNWTKYVNFDLTPYPNLVAFQARIGARPAVQAALTAEGLNRPAA